MSSKLKIFLGILVLIAVFSIVQISTSLLGIAKNSTANIFSQTNRNGIVQTANDTDADHDGLNDLDETDYDTDAFNPDTDGDGFLDGEEVISGYDPLEKNQAVEAQAKKDSRNLTTSYLQTLIGGYVSGDLALDIHDDESLLASIEVLASTVLDDIEANNPNDRSTALLVIDSSDDDLAYYLTQTADLLNTIPPQEKYLTSDNIKNSAYTAMASIFNNANKKMNALAVPQQFAAWHRDTRSALAKLEVLYRSLADSDEDPIRAMVSFELFPDALGDLAISGNQLNIYLQEHKINEVVHPHIDLSEYY